MARVTSNKCAGSIVGSSLSKRQSGLKSKSFLGLLVTQLLDAVNDNMFRCLVIGIGKDFMP